MERIGVSANNQMQFEYSNNNVSLGAEGVTVYLQRPGTNMFEKFFTQYCPQRRSKMGESYMPTQKWCCG